MVIVIYYHLIMSAKNCVLSKIPCFYETVVTEEPSKKKGRSAGREILATTMVREEARVKGQGVATGKLDGCCVRLTERGLEMRQDLRMATKGPHKGKYVSKKGKPANMPATWVPTTNKPELNPERKFVSHIGFRCAQSPGDKYALEVFSEDKNQVRVLTSILPVTIEYVPVENLTGKTYELLGPRINGNFHELEEHCLAPHGGVVVDLGDDQLDTVKLFLTTDPLGQKLEGIVWHMDDGTCYKVHRQHLGM